MNKEKVTTKLINVCAWCGKEQYGVFDESAATTHGICQKCLLIINQEQNKPSQNKGQGKLASTFFAILQNS